MKKLTTLFFISALALSSSAQVFWSEDFGTGCNTGTLANGYATTNGQWNVTDVASPAPYANEWYISAHTRNTGVGNCAADCSGGNNMTLHIGNVPVLTIGAEEGSYLTGFYCGFGYCSTTHKRIESPVIDCSGKTGITLSCIYYEGGDLTPNGTNGDCSIWLYDGVTWSKVDTLAKTQNNCGGSSIYGKWTNFSITLPASVDNNANVKLGFQWDNDDVSVGSDPSAAFDDIQLSTTGSVPPIAGFSTDITSGCDSFCVTFTDTSIGASSRTWYFQGGSPSTSTSATQVVCYNTPGSYDVSLVSANTAGTDSITQSSLITVTESPFANFIASAQNICTGECLTFTDLSTGPVQSWIWTFAGGTPTSSTVQNPSFVCYQTGGTFNVTLLVQNGSCVNSAQFVNYINVNQPVPPVVTLAGDTLTASPANTYQWFELSTGAIPSAIFQSYVATQTGDYYVCVLDNFACNACSDTIHVDLSGIAELNQSSISVYPSPVKNELNVSVSNGAITSITIVDVMGKTIVEQEEKISAATKSVEVSSLAKGAYWVEAKSSSGKIYRAKFVKE
jgi:PKD repeat protein